MSELVDSLEQEWDMLLLDSPPIVAVTDASMISQEIDAMVMVIKAGETDREAFRRAVKSLIGIQVPLAGVVVGLLQLLLTRTTEMAFGPYLCLATVGVMLAWPVLWHGYAEDVFAMGWIIPGLFVAGVCLMGGMLFSWRLIRGGGDGS